MTTITLHEPPAWQGVARQQLRSVGGAMRQMAIVLAAVLVAILLLSIFVAVRSTMLRPDRFGFAFDPGMTVPFGILGLFAAGGVWQREEPSRRAYHLAMPVQRATHTWLRVGAGWVWLMAGVVVTLLMLGLLGVVTAAIGGGALTWRPPVWGWLTPFAAATIIYLLSSIALVGAEQSILWLVGAPFGVWLVLYLPTLYQWRSGAQWVDRLVNSPFNPGVAFWPMIAAVSEPRLLPAPLRWQPVVMGTLFWTAVGLAGVWLAARRTPRAAR